MFYWATWLRRRFWFCRIHPQSDAQNSGDSAQGLQHIRHRIQYFCEVPNNTHDYMKNMRISASSGKTSCFVSASLWRTVGRIGFALALLGFPAVSNAALQGYWTFEEGAGTTTADLSGNANTGTLVNGPGWTNSPFGANCLFFDGVNDRVNLGNPSSLQVVGAMTVSAWVLPHGFSDSGRIVTKGGGSGSRGFALNVENTAGPGKSGSFQVPSSGSALVSVNTTMSLASNQWIHLCGVFEPGVAVRIYTNGFMNNSTATAVTAQFMNSLNVTIGSRPDGTTRFYGLIDHARIYNEALTEAQIQALPELVQTPLAFTLQPVSRTVVENRSNTFSAAITGSLPYYIQWYENDAPIPNANSLTYTIPVVSTSMNGFQYKVAVSNLTYSITSTNAILTVSTDGTPPTLVSVGSVDGNFVGVSFNEPMDQNLFWDPSHFIVNGGAVSVSGSAPRPDGLSAVLSLSAPITGPFFVQVTGVTDLVGNPVAPGSSATGVVAGLTFADLGAPPQPGDTFSSRSNVFEMTAGGADIGGAADAGHFASRSVSGNFDVSVQVPSLSPVNSIAKAGLMVRQALDADSPTVHLLANPPPPSGRGYIEALRRATVGGVTTGWGTTYTAAVMPDVWMRLRRWGDQFAAFRSANGVDWVLMGQTTLALTDPVRLGLAASAHANNTDPTVANFQNYSNVVFTGVTVAFTEQPTNTSVLQNTTAAFYVEAAGAGAPATELAYQWQRGNGAGGFTNLPGETATTYSFVARGADNNAQIRAQVYFAGLITNSATATLTATPETTRPTIVSVVSAGDPARITLVFSEDLDPVSATTPAYYQLSGPGSPPSISGATLGADSRTVILTTSAALTEGPTYTLGVENVLDLALPPNAVAPGTQVTFQYTSLIGYWKFEEGSGPSAADSSVNNSSGTLINAPTWVPGQVGQYSLNFNGSNQRVDIGNPTALQYTGPMTVSAWAWPNSISSSGRIITKGGNSGSRGWSLNVESIDVWRLQIAVNSTTLVSCSVAGVQLNAWTHVVGVFDPNDVGGPIMKVYINGVLAASETSGVPSEQFNPGTGVAIGSRSDGTTQWNGKVDEVRLYARALSDGEIAVLATPPARFLPPVFVNNEFILDWTGQGQLQSAPAVTGVYTNINPAPNAPYTNAVVPGGNRFFRFAPAP